MFRLIRRTIIFIVPFSLLFWYIHGNFEVAVSRSTQDGLAGFYSADGLIFGLIVAFVIQREWETWTKLSEAVRTEIDAAREMWKWSSYAEKSLCEEAHQHIERYLGAVISEWNKGEEATRSRLVDDEIEVLRGMLVKMSLSVPLLGGQLQGAFTDLVDARNLRLNLSNEHMPGILKRIVVFADALLIILSLFIAVDNVLLDFIFTASIGILAFGLILVVDDLDNPFRPGTWHLTPKGYEELLKELTSS